LNSFGKKFFEYVIEADDDSIGKLEIIDLKKEIKKMILADEL